MAKIDCLCGSVGWLGMSRRGCDGCVIVESVLWVKRVESAPKGHVVDAEDVAAPATISKSRPLGVESWSRWRRCSSRRVRAAWMKETDRWRARALVKPLPARNTPIGIAAESQAPSKINVQPLAKAFFLLSTNSISGVRLLYSRRRQQDGRIPGNSSLQQRRRFALRSSLRVLDTGRLLARVSISQSSGQLNLSQVRDTSTTHTSRPIMCEQDISYI